MDAGRMLAIESVRERALIWQTGLFRVAVGWESGSIRHGRRLLGTAASGSNLGQASDPASGNHQVR